MLTLRDVMTARTMTLSPEMPLRDAVELLVKHRVTGAPVLANGKVVGSLSANDVLAFVASTPGVPTVRDDGDVPMQEPIDSWDGDASPANYFTDFWEDAGADVTERFHAVDGPEWDVLDEHFVSEAMSTRVLALPPTATLQVAAEAMQASGMHRVIVLDREHLLGIVSTMDITRAFARHAKQNRAG